MHQYGMHLKQITSHSAIGGELILCMF